jgi:O-antigen/teichoic acid export membrane protein
VAETIAHSLAGPDAASVISGPGNEAQILASGAATEVPAPDDRLRGIRDVRRHLARGMLITGVFQVGLLGVSAIRGVGVGAFISQADYGIWGLIGLTMWTAVGLKNQFGAGEKYIQQSEADQELAFQRGFTMEVLFTAAVLPVAAGVVVAVTMATGRSEVLFPGLLLLLLLPATALQFPIATFYRRLDFRRQRLLQAANPVVAIIVTIGLAVTGAGYWSLVIGTLVGAWAQTLVVLKVCPYPLALRYESGTLRGYLSFSTPLLVTALAVLAEFYVIYLVGNKALGVAGLGAFTLTGNLVQFTDQADSIVTETLYPAVCAVKDRVALLSEIFVKSNRLSLIWAVPFGIGMALFASDLVRLIIGSRWLPAVPVLEIMGVVTAVHHVGYNWAAFVKARGTTWPIVVSALIGAAVVVGAGIPLMFSDHLVGLALAFVLGELAAFVVRGIWLSRLFTGVSILTQLIRGFAPTVIAAAPILALRVVAGTEKSLLAAAAVFTFYAIATIAATVALERPLLREAFGYMLRRRPQTI